MGDSSYNLNNLRMCCSGHIGQASAIQYESDTLPTELPRVFDFLEPSYWRKRKIGFVSKTNKAVSFFFLFFFFFSFFFVCVCV